ncbi:MAG: hypothetical protein ABI759_12575 [Candidatus Solibacter sp.]
MPSYSPSTAETLLADLIHDLRQDLGNIETSVYCVNLAGDSTVRKQVRVQEYLRLIEQQVERAADRLTRASVELMHLRVQRPETAEVRDLTKSATSAVT